MSIFFTLIGFIFGSFINSLVWRINLKINFKTKNKPELSIISGRSMCPKCKHKLSPLDLIPVLSWLCLSGKCRYCKKPISIQYPAVELLTGFLFLFSYAYWPLNYNNWGYILLAIWLVIIVVSISLALYDLKYRILPNNLVYILIFFSAAFIIIYFLNYNTTLAYLFSRIFGVIFSFGIFYLIFQISHGRWIGGGDVKLCIALGLLLGGPLEVIVMIFFASLIGSVVSFFMILTNKLKSNHTIAFGPLLISSTFVCFFFAPQIINWYTTLIK